MNGENRWLKSRRLLEKVVNVVSETNADVDVEDLTADLNRNKDILLNILQNPPKSSVDRTKVTRIGEEVSLADERNIRIDELLSLETIILSDLFNVNEIAALELALAGELELPNFWDLTRGLCAVLCYYSSHRQCVQTLRCLLRARTVCSNPEVVAVVTTFTNSLWNSDLFMRLIDTISSFDVTKELNKLQQPNVKGLGGPKHRNMVSNIISDIQLAVTECLLLWCREKGLRSNEFSMVVHKLREWEDTMDFGLAQSTFWSAAFFAIDTSSIQTMATEEEIGKLPILTNGDLPGVVQSEFSSDQWKDVPLNTTLQLAWAVTLRSLSKTQTVHNLIGEIEEDEEDVLEKAFQSTPLHFIHHNIVGGRDFAKSDLIFLAVDSLLKHFIECFPIKIKELRSETDEELRSVQEAIERGVSPQRRPFLHYEQLLLSLAELYQQSDSLSAERSALMEQLASEFWQFHEPLSFTGDTGGKSVVPRANLAKFVKCGIELSPAVVHVAYLRMITSLSCGSHNALSCFELLRSADSQSRRVQASWEHFFTAMGRYVDTLKRDVTGAKWGVQQTVCDVQISPDELTALNAWLLLAAKVAAQESSCRSSFLMKTNWHCLENTTSLLGSAVPLTLKGAIFRFLAALALDLNCAPKIFERILVSNILSKSLDGRLCGLQDELEGMECQSERYPATSGFLRLLCSLVSHGPYILPSPEIFTPYMQFVTESVLIKFRNRSYKNSAEMWEIGSSAFEVIWKLIRNYDVTADGVSSKDTVSQLLVSLMTDGPLFRMTMSQIVEGITLIEQFDEFVGKVDFEKCCLYSLKVVESCLERQVPLEDATRSSETTVLFAGMETLLQTLNPSTMKADYLSEIAVYVAHSDHLPNHSLSAATILRLLSDKSRNLQPKFVQYLSANERLQRHLTAAFADATSLVDCQIGLNVNTDRDAANDDEVSDAQARGLTAKVILETMIGSLKIGSGTSNLALFVLGFDVRQPQTTQLENPGVNDSLQTCLHSTIQILLSLCQTNNALSLPYCGLFDSALRLVLTLASLKETIEPTLRYLRNAHDLVYQLCASSAVAPIDTDYNEESIELRLTLQGLTYQLAACELKTLILAGQTSQAEKLLSLILFSTTTVQQSGLDDDTLMETHASSTFLKQDRSFNRGSSAFPGKSVLTISTNSPILTLLKSVDLSPADLQSPDLIFFDSKKLSKVLSICTEQTSGALPYCDVEKLNRLLHQEIGSLIGTEFASKLQAVEKEAEKVVEYCVKYNRCQKRTGSAVCCFIGLTDTIDIVCCETPLSFFSHNIQLAVLIDLLVNLLERMDQFEMISETALRMAAAVFHLTGAIISLLNSAQLNNEQKYLNAVIKPFQMLLDYLIRPEVRSAHVKMDIYGSFLNFLNLGCSKDDRREVEKIPVDGTFLSQLDDYTRTDKLLDDRWTVLSRVGSELIHLLSRDACDGPEFVKTTALCCLTVLLRDDAVKGQNLASVLVSSGTVRHLVDEIAEDDTQLNLTKLHSTKALKILYQLKAKMALFIRLAMSEVGSKELQSLAIVQKLTDMKLWTEPPSDLFLSKTTASGDCTPQLMTQTEQRYLHLLLFALRLCSALCSNAYAIHSAVARQILYFLALHSELMSQFLRSQTKQSPAKIKIELLDVASVLVAHLFSYMDASGLKSQLPTEETKIGRFFNQLMKRCDLEKIGPSERENGIMSATAGDFTDANASIVTDLGHFMRRIDSFSVGQNGILL